MSKFITERRKCIEPNSGLSVVHQFEPLGENELNLGLIRLIDKKHLLYPWLGVPCMTIWLNKGKGYSINKKGIERLYRLMGISAVGPKPNISIKVKGTSYCIYKYLLKGLKVVRPNQVWAMDITYFPVQGGYFYPCAIIDLYSRCVVSWSLPNTMTSSWCKQTLQTAVNTRGKPEILIADQGSQFTAYEFCDWVTHLDQGIKLNMDGKGRVIDNIFIERLWRSLKYEHACLFPASDGVECYRGIKKYFEYYNIQRRHQSLDDQHLVMAYKQTAKLVA